MPIKILIKHHLKPAELKAEFQANPEKSTIAEFAENKLRDISRKTDNNYREKTYTNLGTLLPAAGFIVGFIVAIVLAYKFNLAHSAPGKWGEAFGAGFIGAVIGSIPYNIVRDRQRSQIPDEGEKVKLRKAIIEALAPRKEYPSNIWEGAPPELVICCLQ